MSICRYERAVRNSQIHTKMVTHTKEIIDIALILLRPGGLPSFEIMGPLDHSGKTLSLLLIVGSTQRWKKLHFGKMKAEIGGLVTGL
jgi:hypothetical protein